MLKVAGVVILYHPDEYITGNILSYLTSIETLFVIDNSENVKETVVHEIQNLGNIHYIAEGVNKGIAARLNQAARLATEAGYQWLLTMDQDSYFPPGTLESYCQCIENYPEVHRVSMFGIDHENKLPGNDSCQAIKVDQLITSGSIVNLTVFEKTGGFNQALFIDEVDLEYCYKSILAGYDVIKFNHIHLQHQLGKLSIHRSLKDMKASPRVLHSPLRLYYMVRNHLYIRKTFKGVFQQDIERSGKVLLNRIKNNLLYGKHRLLLIRYIFQAWIDFKQGHMGKKSG
jgi:rhamnosyltransferase